MRGRLTIEFGQRGFLAARAILYQGLQTYRVGNEEYPGSLGGGAEGCGKGGAAAERAAAPCRHTTENSRPAAWVHPPSRAMISTSAQARPGRLVTPTALRAGRGMAGKAASSTREAPSSTALCSSKSAALRR